MEKLLSIIIPCYNAESFVLSCLEHIHKLPLSSNEYEIICYNDCSTDKTLDVLENATTQYPNLRIIQGKTNIGPGGGRNEALRKASGEYVWFVDVDDIVLPDVVLGLKRLCNNNQLDVISFNYKDIDENENIIAEPSVFKDSVIMNGLDFVESVFNTSIIYHMGYPWRFIVRKEYLIQNNLFFPENIRYGEDTIWMPQILFFAKKIASLSTFGYMYRHHNQSTCGMFDNSYPGRTIYERCFVASELLIVFANQLEETFKDNRTNKYSLAFRKSASHHYLGQLPIYLGRASLKERKSFYDNLRTKGYNKIIVPYIPFISKLLIVPIFGRFFAEVLAFMYKLKH